MAKIKKSSRPENFQLVINLPSNDDFTEVDDRDLSKKMKELNFITQASLEDLLLNFKFYPRAQSKTKSYLVHFRGQLKIGDARRRPYWQLYLNTSAGVSSKRLLTFLSKEIMGEDKHPSIQLKSVDNVEATLEYVTKSERLELEDTDWWPGIIDFRTTSLKRSIENDKDLKNIITKPRKWQKYITLPR